MGYEVLWNALGAFDLVVKVEVVVPYLGLVVV